MDAEKIKFALADVTAEQDPTIEILTEGAYASGDLDMCHANKATLSVDERKEIMGLLDAKGDPRNWQVAGMYLDLSARWKVFPTRLIAALRGLTGLFL